MRITDGGSPAGESGSECVQAVVGLDVAQPKDWPWKNAQWNDAQWIDDEIVLMGQTIHLPEPAFRSTGSSLLEPAISGWCNVLDQIEEVVGKPFLVVGMNSPLSELALFARASRSWRFGVYVDSESCNRISAETCALISAADRQIFASSKAREIFRNKTVFPLCERSALPMGVSSPERLVPDRRRTVEVAFRVLIICYFGTDCPTVSSLRMEYWFQELGLDGAVRVEVDFASAFNFWDGGKDSTKGVVHRVADLSVSSLLNEEGRLSDWAKLAIQNERLDSAHRSTLGAYWTFALEDYFEVREDEYDVVVISGNPFEVFNFAEYAKRRWNARVVLDYRDPFSNNPRIRPRAKSVAYNRYCERGFNFMADAITVVNEACVGLVEGVPGLPVYVVPNGFDERALPNKGVGVWDDGLVHFVHAGTFTSSGEVATSTGRSSTSGDVLSAELDSDRHRLHLLGGSAELDAEPGVVVHHERTGSAGVLSTVGRAHCGVAILSTTGFATPTKVYDYLAMGIDILIIYHGNPRDCVLFPILDGLSGVYWVHHDSDSVRAFLECYVPRARREESQRNLFSRARSTKDFRYLLADLAGRRGAAVAARSELEADGGALPKGSCGSVSSSGRTSEEDSSAAATIVASQAAAAVNAAEVGMSRSRLSRDLAEGA